MPSLIAISLNPNIGFFHALKALPYIFQYSDNQVHSFEQDFARIHGEEYAATVFYAGRTAWFAILKALGIQEGDEILVPAFTCVAVVNPIRWLGAKPVYVDVTDDFVMDLEDAKRKVTDRTKVVLAQHTFGHVVEIEEYVTLAHEHGFVVVEDCAHALGSMYADNVRVGTKSVAAFFSFGRDKCISAGSGGAVLTADPLLMEKVRTFEQSLAGPGFTQKFQDVLYPMVIEVVYWLYSLAPVLGKMYHQFLLQIGLVKKANSVKEKQGQYEPDVMKRWAAVYAYIGQKQLNLLEPLTQKRRMFVEQYREKLGQVEGILMPLDKAEQTYLRFAFQIPEPNKLRRQAKDEHVILGDWYDQVVGPNTADLNSIGYVEGTCPRAEKIVKHVVNLPTSPRLNDSDVARVIGIVRKFLHAV